MLLLKNKKIFVLGVTGVIGSGKSTLCRFLQKKYGFHWMNADEIVHDLYRPGQPGYRKIVDYFGKKFVGPDGVDRGVLRRVVLKNPQKMWILNKLIHPLVLQKVNKKIVQLIRARAQKKKSVRICIEAIYFEPHDLGKFIHQLIIVDAADEVIMKRLKNRKIPERELHALLTFQRRKGKRDGLVIKNERSRKEFERNLDRHIVSILS